MQDYSVAMATLDIARLTRLGLIGELWDSLLAEDMRPTPTQDAELARRTATFDNDACETRP